MGASRASSLLVVSLLFHSLLLANAGDAPSNAIEIPPFNVTQKDVLPFFSVKDGNIKLDVPAIFVFGDSWVDSGNQKILKPNDSYSPVYGLDFHGNSILRQTNGRNLADFIAQIVGLPSPPPYMSLSESKENITLKGINYGSGGCGILPDKAVQKAFGVICMSLDEQIRLFEKTIENLKGKFNSSEDLANYLSKSLFLIIIGTNDYGLSYVMKDKTKGGLEKYTEETFGNYLSEQLSVRLQILYKLGARKILANNLDPQGCHPIRILKLKPQTPCVESDNVFSSSYRNHVAGMLQNLEQNCPGSKIVLLDVYKVFEDAYKAPSSFGIKDWKNPCCAISKLYRNPGCAADDLTVCTNRKEYMFYDGLHPTEVMHYLMTKRCLTDPSICKPMNLLQLLQA